MAINTGDMFADAILNRAADLGRSAVNTAHAWSSGLAALAGMLPKTFTKGFTQAGRETQQGLANAENYLFSTKPIDYPATEAALDVASVIPMGRALTEAALGAKALARLNNVEKVAGHNLSKISKIYDQAKKSRVRYIKENANRNYKGVFTSAQKTYDDTLKAQAKILNPIEKSAHQAMAINTTYPIAATVAESIDSRPNVDTSRLENIANARIAQMAAPQESALSPEIQALMAMARQGQGSNSAPENAPQNAPMEAATMVESLQNSPADYDDIQRRALASGLETQQAYRDYLGGILDNAQTREALLKQAIKDRYNRFQQISQEREDSPLAWLGHIAFLPYALRHNVTPSEAWNRSVVAQMSTDPEASRAQATIEALAPSMPTETQARAQQAATAAQLSEAASRAINAQANIAASMAGMGSYGRPAKTVDKIRMQIRAIEAALPNMTDPTQKAQFTARLTDLRNYLRKM